MEKPEIVEEKPVSMVELKEELASIKKKDKGFNIRAQRTEEYLAQFITLNNTKAKELIEKINKLNIPRLKDMHIIKIVDVMPKTVDDLKAVLQGYTITISNDNLKRIIEVIKKVLE